MYNIIVKLKEWLVVQTDDLMWRKVVHLYVQKRFHLKEKLILWNLGYWDMKDWHFKQVRTPVVV